MRYMRATTDTSRRGSDIRYALHLLKGNPIVLAGTIISIASLIEGLLSGLMVDPNSWKHYDFNLRLCWNNHAIDWHIRNVFVCSGNYPLGTDAFGRDLLKMIILAIPLDVQIALEVVTSAVVIGIAVGGFAGYVGGKIDEVILRVTDVFLSIPSILLAIILLVIVGRSFIILTFAVLITWWPTYVRLVRSQVLSEKEKPYVETLRVLAAGGSRILFGHVIPNSIYPLLVQATMDIGSVMLTIAALTFLGFAPSPLIPELGNLANQGISYFFIAPWLIIFPGLTIFIISIGFNLLGDGVRDIFDPRLRR